jgi:hypothetical protein
MKRIKIKHPAFSDTAWYSKFVGQDFEYITEDENNYYVKTGDKIGSVEKVDGEVIDEQEISTHPLLNDLLQQQKNEAQKPTKQTEGKLFWEMNWDYLQGVAKRMQANKGDKYEKFAWKKGVDVNELNQAILRHTVEIMKGNTIDDTEYGHYEALCCNAMLAVHELKRLKNNAK